LKADSEFVRKLLPRIEAKEKAAEREYCTTKVHTLLDRIPIVARHLARARHGQRPLLIMEDEHDLQYLMHAVLLTGFVDVRPEEWTPNYAGSASRMDFLIMPVGIALEAKMTRDTLTDKGIAEQLIVDIEKYQVHPNCKTLFCFVYDPQSKLRNPVSIERDLSKPKGDPLKVFVVVRPR
jgi:hypothetical protein